MEWMFITNAWTIFKKSNTIESSMHITTYIKNTPAFVIFEFSPLYNKTLQLKTTSAKKGVLFIYKTVVHKLKKITRIDKKDTNWNFITRNYSHNWIHCFYGKL